MTTLPFDEPMVKLVAPLSCAQVVQAGRPPASKTTSATMSSRRVMNGRRGIIGTRHPLYGSAVRGGTPHRGPATLLSSVTRINRMNETDLSRSLGAVAFETDL